MEKFTLIFVDIFSSAEQMKNSSFSQLVTWHPGIQTASADQMDPIRLHVLQQWIRALAAPGPVTRSIQFASNFFSSKSDLLAALGPAVTMNRTRVESDWYKALFEEDCVEVSQLLKDHPDLLNLGWTSNLQREVQGRPVNFWKEERKSEWKGRTALHVAARRGCAELVHQVIEICNEPRNTTKKRCLSNSPKLSEFVRKWGVDRSNTIAGSSGSHDGALAASEHARRGVDVKGKSIACSSHSQDDAHETITEPPQIAESSSADEDPGTNSGETFRHEKRSNMMAELLTALHGVEGTTDETTGSAFANWERNHGEDRNADDIQDRGRGGGLNELLPLKDGEYKLEAIAIALLNGNLDVLSPLMRQSILCYDQLHGRTANISKIAARSDQSAGMQEERTRLRERTEGLVNRILTNPVTHKTYGSILEAYDKHRDFNFLPWEEYLFHFLFSCCFSSMHDDDSVMKAELLRELLWSFKRDTPSQEHNLRQFLLQLQDGQGRTPLHVAVDERTVKCFVPLLRKYSGSRSSYATCAMEARDASGRTPVHRAIALGALDELHAMGDLWQVDWRVFEGRLCVWWFPLHPETEGSLMENVVSCMQARGIDVADNPTLYEYDTDVSNPYSPGLDLISQRNGFQGRRLLKGKFVLDPPFQTAIVHKRNRIVEEIMESLLMSQRGVLWSRLKFFQNQLEEPNYFYEQTESFLKHRPTVYGSIRPFSFKIPCYLSALELAILVGETSMVRKLVQALDIISPTAWELRKHQDVLKYWSGIFGETNFSLAILFAARHGNYELLKETMENSMLACDPFAEDPDGNTALHYAMKMGSTEIVDAHLLDFVNCEHIQENDPRISTKKHSSNIERRGCINLLLQKGCDIFKPNHKGETPYPSGDLSTDADFLSWWYEKQTKEFGEIQNTMSFAANAISVTAALVATTSFVGPLQPPLGYGGDDQIQANKLWVKAFVVCDTLSFYFAIASITFSLIPSLPLPQQSMMKELRQKRTMITLATVLLFPSIICILVAFASSSVAATIENGASSIGGSLAITTSSIGGFVCLLAFIVFLIRLIKLTFTKDTSRMLKRILRRLSPLRPSTFDVGPASDLSESTSDGDRGSDLLDILH